MSFKFIKIEKKIISKESSDFEENDDSDNENIEDENINQINNYQINNNLSSKILSQNITKNPEINLNKEKAQEKEQENNKNTETQFYELTTNGLVEKIKTDYDSIYINQQKEINNFVEKLAKENSELKLKISELNQEIIKLQIKNEFYIDNNNINKNNEINIINRDNEINKEKIENEKKRIKEEYNYIMQNMSSNIISKNIKYLYDTLMNSLENIFQIQKINFLLQEENDKLKAENTQIKLNFLEQKNKIMQSLINIKSETNAELNLLKKNQIFEKNNEIINWDNNVYLYYIEKIKNLTYEKNKLLTSNYDFFIKINDLSQIIEEKNITINSQLQKISSDDLKILNLEQQLNTLKIKNKEIISQLNLAQEKMDESSFEKNPNNFLEEKIFLNKYNILKKQYENKITQLNKVLECITQKNLNLNQKNEDVQQEIEKLLNDNSLKENLINTITNEKNKLIKELNEIKINLKLKEEQLITNETQYENKIKTVKENLYNENTNKANNIDIDKVKSLINTIYEKIPNDICNNKNINSNINLFLKKNINEIAKLNEINKAINVLNKNQEINLIIKSENEQLKNHIKEIINLTLDKTNIIYLEKLIQDSPNISFEQLFLKIINYIKIHKICYSLQKIKTVLNYSEKYISRLSEKNTNININNIQEEINKINEEMNEIKNGIKNISLDLEKKVKNFLAKDEIKVEVNNIQKKYEKIITDIFEYFLQYKNITNNKEILTLQIPIKSYNAMIENNMNNLTLITQSIDSWNNFINNESNEINDIFFQELINMTNITNNLDSDNLSDLFIQENNDENENDSGGDERNVIINENENENFSEGKDNEENENENESQSQSQSQYTLENKE